VHGGLEELTYLDLQGKDDSGGLWPILGPGGGCKERAMTAPGGRPRYDVNLSMLFTELPLLERPAAAAAEGFDAVEFWWPFDRAVPADKDVDAFVAAVEDAGVQLVGLNTFAGNMLGGDRGLVSWPARSSEFRDNIDVTVSLGSRLGCRAFNALYGNRLEAVSPQQQDELGA
jgi:hydroxypyruvate isomerase